MSDGDERNLWDRMPRQISVLVPHSDDSTDNWLRKCYNEATSIEFGGVKWRVTGYMYGNDIARGEKTRFDFMQFMEVDQKPIGGDHVSVQEKGDSEHTRIVGDDDDSDTCPCDACQRPKALSKPDTDIAMENASCTLRAIGHAYPRTCRVCGLGPCRRAERS